MRPSKHKWKERAPLFLQSETKPNRLYPLICGYGLQTLWRGYNSTICHGKTKTPKEYTQMIAQTEKQGKSAIRCVPHTVHTLPKVGQPVGGHKSHDYNMPAG
eukprot:4510691-Pyramimonas_sp.AAC.1